MRQAVGLTAMLALLARVGAADAQTPTHRTYQLESLRGPLHVRASAFVVVDRRQGHEGGLLLMTALHGIAHASSIQVEVVDGCEAPKPAIAPFDVTNPVDILTWPGLDVAALVIPKGRYQEQLNVVAPKTLAHAQSPERLSRIWVDAKAGPIVCAPMETTAVTGPADNPTAAELFRSLSDAHPDLEWNHVMGSLANDAQLFEYSPPADLGASGASVTRRASQEVFAVHLGSSPQAGWGVLLYGLDERNAPACDDAPPTAPSQLGSQSVGPFAAVCTKLDRDHPTVEVPGFLAPDFTQLDSQRLAATDLSRHGLALLADVDVDTPVDPFGAWRVSPQLGVSREFWSPGFAPLTGALAVRAAAGPTFGQFRSPVFVPGRFEEDPLKGTARLPFVGALGALGLEVHFARLSPVAVVAGAGIRGGWVHQRDVVQRPDSVTWGPDIRAAVKWRVARKVSGTAHLSFTYAQIPVAACPNGCAGPSVPRDSVWDLWGGGGLGFEFEP